MLLLWPKVSLKILKPQTTKYYTSLITLKAPIKKIKTKNLIKKYKTHQIKTCKYPIENFKSIFLELYSFESFCIMITYLGKQNFKLFYDKRKTTIIYKERYLNR